MSVTALKCPSCGASATATTQVCTYCGSNLHFAGSPAGHGASSGPGTERVDVELHPPGAIELAALMNAVGPAVAMPRQLLANRLQDGVFILPNVDADQVDPLRARLANLGISIEVRPASGRPGPRRGGPPGGPRGFGGGPGGGGPRGVGGPPRGGPRGPGGFGGPRGPR